MTTFADQVQQFGGSPVGGLPYSWLLGPQGRVIFVSPYRTASASSGIGQDGNPGTFNKPMKTVAAAYAETVAGRGDIIYMMANSNASADVTEDISSTLTWANDGTHLIGLTTPSMVSQRARFNQLSTATGVSPMVNVTADNCTFANLQFFQGVADATSLINVQVTGQRNYFDNVHFAGVGHATMSAAGCASLNLEGASENVFKHCVIGVDTATMDADGRNMTCDGDASRNLFEDCIFQAFISATGAGHVEIIDGTGIDRWLMFRNCQFISESVNKTVDMAEVFIIPAGIAQGKIILHDSYAMNDGGAPVWTAGTEGIIWANMVASAASAAGGLMTNL
jgi:hypothetical protein